MAEIDPAQAHKPVLLDECVQLLQPAQGGLFVDATLGLGGHSEALLRASDRVRLVGIDQDVEALEIAKNRLAEFADRALLVQSNFSELATIVDEKCDGIIADLGVSSLQLDRSSRGSAFVTRLRLTCGWIRDQGPTAADLLATMTEQDLADVIYKFGEERGSRKIARLIVEKRNAGEPVRTTRELAELVRRAVRTSGRWQIDPATRTFQALRIAVNRELEILDGFISNAVDLLKSNGVLAVITFHSLEDRIVKRAFLRLSGRCECPPRMPACECGATRKVEIITGKPIRPTPMEMNENPVREAKLRACRKI